VVDRDRPDRKDGSAYDPGRIHDLAAPLHDADRVEIVTPSPDDRDSVPLIRHNTPHVLAAGVLDLYPGTKISIGPPIEDGFYYDFEFPDGVTVSEHDFEQLEAMMREHVKAHEPLVREDIPVADALERFTRASARREADSPADAASSGSERSGTTTSETRTSTRCSAASSSASSGSAAYAARSNACTVLPSRRRSGWMVAPDGSNLGSYARLWITFSVLQTGQVSSSSSRLAAWS
jgi:hypothetical protein